MTGAIHLQPSNRRLILFGRYPTPGKVKTRLIPAMGALGAAELHRSLAEKSLATALTSGGATTPVDFYSTGSTCSQVRKWLGPQPVRLCPQSGSGLGERMRNAIFDAFDQGCRSVVLVGTDIPHMTPDHLEDAFDALIGSDVVLGPSKDGGYWLVGLRHKVDIFQGIQWGSANVLDQTLAVAKKHGLSVNCIQTLNDMDTEADLKEDMPLQEWQRPYLSVIIPTLNEEKHIAAVIQSIQDAQCEIIVSDGGSTDRTVTIARDLGAKVIIGDRGRALQQNAGATVAAGNVLLFLHADTLLPSNYGHQVFGILLSHQVAAGAFRFKTDYDHWGMRFIEKIVHLRSTLFQMPYGDQALFMRKTTFEKAGGFPLVPIAEDLYFVSHLGQLGRIALAPGSAIASARRWRNIGIWRATLINYLIAIGYLAGINPKKLAPLYRLWVK